MYRSKGMFRLFRSLSSGILYCSVQFDLPELKPYFEPYPAMFACTVTADENENPCLELISILERLKKTIDHWILYLKARSDVKV